jgi:outer membrane protein W
MNRNLLMSALLIGVSTAAMAQKPVDSNPSSLEVQLNLTGNSNTIVAPMLKYRYFVSNNIAIRFGLGLDNSKVTNKFAENADGTGAVGEQEIKSSNLQIMPGVEYHFAGTDRLSPYLGLTIGIGSGKETEKWTNYDGTGYNNGVNADVDAPNSSFGVGLLAGADIYVMENIFLGVEMGLLMNSFTQKESTTTVSSGGTTNTIKTPEAKSSSMGISETAAIRVGWRF